MLTIFFRSVILFLFAVASIRFMGKRQVGQLQPFELVVAILIADLVATPMEDVGTPLLYGIVPMIGLVVLHGILTLLSMKSQKLRALICGTPAVLIKDGVIQLKELEKLCFNLNDLMEELRSGGILNPADVGTAIMETSGKVNIFPTAGKSPITPEDVGLTPDRDGIPLMLILDGAIQKQNLEIGKISGSWLDEKLNSLGFASHKEVLLCSLDMTGKLLVQGKKANHVKLVDAMPPSGIVW